MKKVLIVILLFFLTSCTSIISSLQDLVAKDPDDSVIQPQEPEVLQPLPEINVENGKTYHFNDNLKKNGPLTTEGLPSIGSPKLLVIPISFSDSNTSDATKNKIKHDLNIAFNGTQEETGYYSVNEFYKISSYQKLDLQATILDFYEAINPSRYYKNDPQNRGSDLILEEAINYYDESIDFTQYDYDNDGYIDGIWLIYDHPVDYNYADFWWAFQTSGFVRKKFDGKSTHNYGFAGSDFMYDKKHTGYNTSNIKIDAHTYIHETGHMMGLDDYYSYNSLHNSTSAYGTYGYDMMDQTHGDHGVLSKLLLGWIDPYIITKDTQISLESFAKTGQALLITDNFKGTIYDHYYLVVCYDESYINKKDKPIPLPLFTTDGIVVYECHAEKPPKEEYVGEYYLTGFAYNNSDNKIYSKKKGFDYEKSEWFVRFLTNGPESKNNTNVIFKAGDMLDKNLFFNFKILSRSEANSSLDKYNLEITFNNQK